MKNSYYHIVMLVLAVGALMAFRSETEGIEQQHTAVQTTNTLDLGGSKPNTPIHGKDYRFMVKGEIQRFARSGCGMMIRTEDGLLEVVEMPEHDFDLKIGQTLVISYETQNEESSCGAEKTVVMYDFDLVH